MKKMTKKFIALGLSMIMVLSLAACGSSGSSEPQQTQETQEAQETQEVQETQEPAPADDAAEADTQESGGDLSASITLWTYPIGNWGDSATVDGLIASFNEKYPNIAVTVEYLDYTNGDDQINTAIEGGQAPDLVMEGPERLVANWGSRGLMVDLSDLFATEAGGEIYESVDAACKSSDGKYYEYPLCMVAHCMAINRNVFEAADALQYLDEENHTWTTEGFLKAVQAVYDSGQENVGAIYCSGQGGDQGTRAIINNMYSSTFTNAEHTAYTADTPENIKAIHLLTVGKRLLYSVTAHWQCPSAGMQHSRLIRIMRQPVQQITEIRFFQCFSLPMMARQNFAVVFGDSVYSTMAIRQRLMQLRLLSTLSATILIR